MDAASRLIAELSNKLAELDSKVLAYRHNMAAQFGRFQGDLLDGQPEEITRVVNEAVEERLSGSQLADIPEDGLPPVTGAKLVVSDAGAKLVTSSALEVAEGEAGGGKKPAPIIVPQLNEAGEEIQRSPHARENEFLGVFTQGYLPLLDSDKQHEKRAHSESISSVATSESAGAMPIVQSKKLEIEPVSTGLSVSYSPPRVGAIQPEHKRRNTGDTASLSNPEGHLPRRSALRRSSSSGRAHSLRKVRFEFQGVEFPTTSSPNVVSTHLAAAMSGDKPGYEGSSILSSEEDSAQDEQIEYIEYVEEEVVPKRISSSQALRMLSRGPIEEDGTRWEEVVAPQDGSASVNVGDANLDTDDEEELVMMKSRSTSPSPPDKNKGAVTDARTAPPVDIPNLDDNDEMTLEERKEEDDILADMAPLAPMHSTRTVMGNNSSSATITTTTTFTPFVSGVPSTETVSIPTTASSNAISKTIPPSSLPIPAGAARSQKQKQKSKAFTLGDSDTDEDLPFDFEDSAPTFPPKSKRPPSPEEEDESSSDEESAVSPERGIPASLSAYATSPARDIAGRGMGLSPNTITATNINTYNNSGYGSLGGLAASLRGANGSLGRAQGDATPLMPVSSLRGQGNPMSGPGGSSLRNSYHPFQVPVVSMHLNEEARRMGEFNTFVGSVHGTTGMDEWDGRGSWRGAQESLRGSGSLRGAGSLRASGNNDEGAQPMSFSERLAIEEWKEQRAREEKWKR